MKTLKLALKRNAVFSLATGIILVFCSATTAHLFGVSQDRPFFFLGFGLILFALVVFHISRKKPVDAFNALLITILDSIWVMASILLLIIDPFQFSTAGNVMITVVALIVLSFALMQVFAIIKINRHSNSGAATQKAL